MAKYMSHREFKPRILAKLSELRAAHGETIFKKSGALKKGPARTDYTAWYASQRVNDISGHEKQYPPEYYERQGLAIARIVEQERRNTGV